MRHIILFITVAILFTGCLYPNHNNHHVIDKYKFNTNKTDFNLLVSRLTVPLKIDLKTLQNKKTLYIVDFVNISQLHNNSQLGFVLSNALKSHIAQNYQYDIRELEVSKYVKIGANGTKILSRDINDLKTLDLLEKSYILVGTYAITNMQMILHLKLINLENNLIVNSSSISVDLTDEILYLDGIY